MSTESRTLWFNPHRKCWEWQETRTETRQHERPPKKPKRWTHPNHNKSVSQSYARAHVRGPLTDKKIAKYAKKGLYSAVVKQARKELAQKVQAARQGGFVEVSPGRMIYSPL